MSKKERGKKDIEVFVGSDNIFKDTGHPNPEEALAKAELAIQIYRIIQKRKLTQKQAAEIMGLDQPRVSDILCGRLSRFSLDRLMRCLRTLGRNVEIRITRPVKRAQKPTLSVVTNRSSPKQERRPQA